MFSHTLNLEARKIFLATVCALFCAGAVFAQTTTFTYQGRLQDGGMPANGNYDFTFGLFDTLTGGTQIGSTQTVSTVNVSNGSFSVQLDFGAAAFPGANRFLEMSVRLAGSGSFTSLSPRQQITSTPYAIRSKSTDMATRADTLSNACVGCVSTVQGGTGLSSSGAAGNFLKSNGTIWIGGPIGPPDIGGFGPAGNFLKSNGAAWTSAPIAPADLPAGSGNYIQNTPVLQVGAADFNISGNGTAGGTLSANIVNATTQYNLVSGPMGSSRVLSSTTSGAMGSGNTFVGINTGSNGAYNTFVGTDAGASNTTGQYNSFFGKAAGAGNTTGSLNAFFGLSAGSSNTTARANAFFGSEAGQTNTTGDDNAFFGRRSGFSNTIGANNAFFGSGAGQANTTGFENSFFGSSAGKANTTGVENAFFGFNAGAANTSSFNSFFGHAAGESNTTGSSNSFFGVGAGDKNTRGSGNAFFGAAAGFSNTEGLRNAFFGDSAGQTNTMGSTNAFFGDSAGFANTLGGNNTFFGNSAGVANIAGSGNVFVGGSSGSGNVLGNNNTLIGARANVTADGLTNATAIGADSAVGTSNTMVLGASSGTTAVQVPGTLKTSKTLSVGQLDSGSTQLCRNDSNLNLSLCSSSLRYKTKVASFAGGLNIVNRLRPISFTWKTGGARDLGLAAEEVAAVEPLLVTHNAKGQIEGVKYDRLSAVLVNAVNQQQEQIKQQHDLVAQQQSQIEMLRTANAALNARLRSVERVLAKKARSRRHH